MILSPSQEITSSGNPVWRWIYLFSGHHALICIKSKRFAASTAFDHLWQQVWKKYDRSHVGQRYHDFTYGFPHCAKLFAAQGISCWKIWYIGSDIVLNEFSFFLLLFYWIVYSFLNWARIYKAVDWVFVYSFICGTYQIVLFCGVLFG